MGWTEILFGKGSTKSSNRTKSLFSTNDVYDDEHVSYKSNNLSDRIEREAWRDHLDRCEHDNPWDCGHDDCF